MRSSLVLHLLEEFVGGILITVLLHLGQMTLLWCHRCIHLATRRKWSGKQNDYNNIDTNRHSGYFVQKSTLTSVLYFTQNHLFIQPFTSITP